MARNSCTTVGSVRTTPFTCGSQASVTIRIMCEGAGGSISSQPINSSRMRASGSCALRRSVQREKGQTIGRRPVDQLKPSVVMLDQRGAALHPVAIVEVQDALHLAYLCVVDVAAYDAVEAATAGLAGKRRFVSVDRLDRLLHLAFQPRGQRPVRITQAAPHRVE